MYKFYYFNTRCCLHCHQLSASFRVQFQVLFSYVDAQSTIVDMCTSSPDKYLSTPAGSSIDLNSILTQFCKTNWTIVSQELLSDVNIDGIIAQVTSVFYCCFNRNYFGLKKSISSYYELTSDNFASQRYVYLPELSFWLSQIL